MFKFYFPVDIFDHLTSLARASRSRVSKNRRDHFISASRRLPACGGSACISMLYRNTFM